MGNNEQRTWGTTQYTIIYIQLSLQFTPLSGGYYGVVIALILP